jgi:hypothetical protein
LEYLDLSIHEEMRIMIMLQDLVILGIGHECHMSRYRGKRPLIISLAHADKIQIPEGTGIVEEPLKADEE